MVLCEPAAADPLVTAHLPEIRIASPFVLFVKRSVYGKRSESGIFKTCGSAFRHIAAYLCLASGEDRRHPDGEF